MSWASSRKKRYLRATVEARDGTRCHWCGVETEADPFRYMGHLPSNARTLDHVVRRRDQGANHATNLVIACRDCNERDRH